MENKFMTLIEALFDGKELLFERNGIICKYRIRPFEDEDYVFEYNSRGNWQRSKLTLAEFVNLAEYFEVL